MQYLIFILAFYPFVLFFSNTFSNLKFNNISCVIYYFFVFLVILAAGLRGNNDEYTRIFVLLPSLNDFYSWDFGLAHEKGIIFYIISSFFKTIGLNSQSIFLFFSGTAVFIHAFFFRKFTKYYFLAFMLYLSHEIAFKEFSGLRMGFASALVLPMIYYLNDKKNYKFLMLLVIASLVHYVAILTVILFFLQRKFHPNLLWFGLIFSLILYETHTVYNVMRWLSSKGYLTFSQFNNYDLIFHYMESIDYSYDAGYFHPKTLQQVIVVSFLIYLYGYKNNNSSLYNLLFNTYYLSTILYIVFSELALFAFRFGGHFYSVEPILLTYIIYSFRQKMTIVNLITVFALIIAFVNYVLIVRLDPYFLFAN